MRTLLARLDRVTAGLREAQDAAQSVIVTDVDGTLVDITARALAALKRVGVTATADNWDEVMAALDRETKTRFYPHFYSDVLAKKDRPIPATIKLVKRLAARTGLPVVVLTGRPDTMGHTHDVADMLRREGIAVSRVMQRPANHFVKAERFKPAALKAAGLRPAYAIDDDLDVLAAFAAEWPEAELWRVDGQSVRRR